MAVEESTIDQWLVQNADGLELDFLLLQGLWTEEQYLKLTDQTNHLLEFTDGVIEVLPMPTRQHQKISAYLYRTFFAIAEALGGLVLYAPLRVQVRPGKFREPDLCLLLDEQDPRNENAFWPGADLVIEIVSPDKPKRDTEEKPIDYAEGSIPEYWIVNPIDQTITVLTLAGEDYATHGQFHSGEQVTSALLPYIMLDVDAIFKGS